MESRKKRYTKPQLIVHGDLEKITRLGGHSNTDVPIGTAVVNNDISTITS
ncbi:MAG: lasso peptide [Chloroflexi bacterium]|nr:lasso peptide [Chloroflexota bacterium]